MQVAVKVLRTHTKTDGERIRILKVSDTSLFALMLITICRALVEKRWC